MAALLTRRALATTTGGESNVATEAFFSTLPATLLPAEEELRDGLRLVTNAAGALLPSDVTLQEWVERRMPGEVTFSTSASGAINLSIFEEVAGASLTDAFFDKLPVDSFLHEEERLRAALTTALAGGPLSLNIVMADLKVKAARSAILPKEVQLHEWIERRIGAEVTVFLDDKGQRVCELASQSPAAGSPPDVKKQSVAGTISAATPASREAFFADLPADVFRPEEEILRDAMFDFLAAWKSQELATLSHIGGDRAVQNARASFLPKEVSLKEWIERRIGGDIELTQDKKTGQWVVHLSVTARPIVTAKYEAMEKAAREQEAVKSKDREQVPAEFFASLPTDALKDEEVNLRGALLDWLHTWHANKRPGAPPPVLADAGQSKGVQHWRAILLPREVTLREWIERRIGAEIELLRDERGQYQVYASGKAPKSMAPPPPPPPPAPPAPPVLHRRAEPPPPGPPPPPTGSALGEAFFARLPEDELSPEELALRDAVFDWIEQSRPSETPPFLSDASRDRTVQQARTELLPAELPLRMWIERRIGGEVEVTKDERGRFLLYARNAERPKREEGNHRRDQLEAFFESLPSDGFAPEEERLRDAVLQFLENWKGEEPPTLTHAGQDPDIKKGRISFLKNVSLKEWIDRRIGGEVEMAMAPSEQWVVGIRGTIDLSSLAKKRSPGADGTKGGRSGPAWKKPRGDERAGPLRR
eukprot:TRINITY_DN7105_c0_g1_i1.p1 TRINITY_DN7105_c0_g1~~TRINITY_DN7105_c0_g1_i1.p1  ORF type:complete len:730 (-),score=161.31 TRINITY_DN7105_c0_g1_i1:182-2299(-)